MEYYVNPVLLIPIYKEIADKYHNRIHKQVRKYNGLPYTVHTDEVELLVASVEPDNIVARAAAHGHDLYEDVFPLLSNEGFKERMEHEVGNFVSLGAFPQLKVIVREINDVIIELSNRFTSERYPALNRDKRKELERNRLASISNDAQTVKLADIISNTNKIFEEDPGWARIYTGEKREVVPLLTRGNTVLHERAKKNVERRS